MEDMAEGLMEAKMIIRRTRIRQAVVFRTRGEEIPFIFVIRTKEIREEEEEGRKMEEQVFVENGFTIEKKNIKHLNVPGDKEGQIR